MDILQVDPATGEVFLRLPAPYVSIIITPPREGDAADIVVMLNDPKVYKSLVGPPFPYHPHHAEEWLRMTKDHSVKVLEDLHEGRTVVDGCPVQYIRETQPHGTDLLLGDVSTRRNDWVEVDSEELRAQMTKENLEKPVGDPSIVWTIGGVSKAQSSIAML
jgi:RimJ/RimL family protein N-acetyltransferase